MGGNDGGHDTFINENVLQIRLGKLSFPVERPCDVVGSKGFKRSRIVRLEGGRGHEKSKISDPFDF